MGRRPVDTAQMLEKTMEVSRRRENVTFAEVVKGINTWGAIITTHTKEHITKENIHSPAKEDIKKMVIQLDTAETESWGNKLLAEVKSFKSLQCLYNLCRGEGIRYDLIKTKNQCEVELEPLISSDGEETTGDDWSEETSDDDFDEVGGEPIFQEYSPELDNQQKSTRDVIIEYINDEIKNSNNKLRSKTGNEMVPNPDTLALPVACDNNPTANIIFNSPKSTIVGLPIEENNTQQDKTELQKDIYPTEDFSIINSQTKTPVNTEQKQRETFEDDCRKEEGSIECLSGASHS
ncbi:hypothetical protein L2E82_49959 [Cichorium intybus]|nr:hypothetical protein L2E82_49959 [Cichorium intybus]